MVGIAFETTSFITFSSLLIITSIFVSATSAQEMLNSEEEVFVSSRLFPALFTGPFTRRSIPLNAEEASFQVAREEGEGENKGYVVQKLFSPSNQQRNNAAPLYPVVFSRKPNKVWAPHNLRFEHHQSKANAMKQILMRMNYQ